MVTASPVPRRRVAEESAERWQKALERAEDLRVYQCASTGALYVTSGSEDGVVYGPVSFTEWQCPAALAGDVVCKHRAKVRECFGLLERPAPAPEPTPFRGVNYIPGFLTRMVRTDPGDSVDLLGRRCPGCGGSGRERDCGGHAVRESGVQMGR